MEPRPVCRWLRQAVPTLFSTICPPGCPPLCPLSCQKSFPQISTDHTLTCPLCTMAVVESPQCTVCHWPQRISRRISPSGVLLDTSLHFYANMMSHTSLSSGQFHSSKRDHREISPRCLRDPNGSSKGPTSAATLRPSLEINLLTFQDSTSLNLAGYLCPLLPITSVVSSLSLGPSHSS